MKLSEGINKAIEMFGKNILIEKRLLNILTDYNSFEHSSTPTKRILSSILEDKMLKDIFNESFDFTFSLNTISHTLINEYGYNPQCVDEVLNEIKICFVPNFSYNNLSINSEAEECLYIDDNFYLKKFQDKWVIMDKFGDDFTTFSTDYYDDIKIFKNGYLLASRENKWGIIDIKGSILESFVHISIDECKPLLSFLPILNMNLLYCDKYLKPFRVNENDWFMGIKDIRDEKIIKVAEQWNNISKFNYGLATYDNYLDNKYGFIDNTGSFTKFPEFDEPIVLYYPITRVKINGKYGIIRIDGKFLIPPIYNELDRFHSLTSLIRAKIGKKWGYINLKNETVIDFKFNDAMYFERDLAAVKNNKNLWGFVNKEGAVCIPFKYEDVDYFSNTFPHMIRAKYMGKWGFIDRKGTVVIEFKYEEVLSEFDILIGVKLNGKWGFIDKEGTVIIDFKYEELVESYGNSLYGVKLNGKWGFIDKTDTMIIKNKYKELNYFYKGVCFVKNFRNKWGAINEKGEKIIEFLYDKIDEDGILEKNGIDTIEVTINRSIILIDMKGNYLEYIGEVIGEEEDDDDDDNDEDDD